LVSTEFQNSTIRDDYEEYVSVYTVALEDCIPHPVSVKHTRYLGRGAISEEEVVSDTLEEVDGTFSVSEEDQSLMLASGASTSTLMTDADGTIQVDGMTITSDEGLLLALVSSEAGQDMTAQMFAAAAEDSEALADGSPDSGDTSRTISWGPSPPIRKASSTYRSSCGPKKYSSSAYGVGGCGVPGYNYYCTENFSTPNTSFTTCSRYLEYDSNYTRSWWCYQC